MQRTCFKNKFLKNPTDLNIILYNKQRNYCVSSLRKKKYILTNIKKFFHTKLFFSDEVKSKEVIMVVSNDNIESKETEVAKTFYVFSQILLKIFKFRNTSVRMTSTIDYPVIQS